MFYQNLIDEFINISVDIIGDKLTGIYLHGSLAMNCFNPEKSDIDLLVVIESDISDIEKLKFLKEIVKLNDKVVKNGLEISIVKRQNCNLFVYPTPFELHFSPMHIKCFKDNPEDYVKKMKGVDKDLAAHITIINRYGIVLYGELIEKVFKEVPINTYVESIWLDIKDSKENIIDKPVYIILNILRVLAFLREGSYLSKKQAGQWGIENVSKNYQVLISQALDCYCTNELMNLNKDLLDKFVDEMLNIIELDINKKFPELL